MEAERKALARNTEIWLHLLFFGDGDSSSSSISDDGGGGGNGDFTRFCTSYLVMMHAHIAVCVCARVKYIAYSLITFIFYFIDGLTVSGPVYYSYGCYSMSFYILLVSAYIRT